MSAKIVASLKSSNTTATSLGVGADGVTFTIILTNVCGSKVEKHLVPVLVNPADSFSKHPPLGSDHNITTLYTFQLP